MKKIALAACTLLAAAHADAHPSGTVHWHASDVAGLLVVAVGALAAIWLASRE